MSGSFSADLSRLVANAGGNLRAVVAKTVLDIGEAVVMQTPVGDPTTWKREAPPGYVGGRARGSWQYGFNAPPATDPGTIDGTGGASLSRVQVGIAANQAPGVHYITSTVPYMRRLEYEAWSAQAPDGMVRKTILEFQQFVEANAKAVR